MSEIAPRRFYKDASVAPGEGGFAVALDGRPLRTPAKAPLLLPTHSLAEAIAAEWAGQGEAIRPDTMPLTRLANVALDRAALAREALAAEIAKYGETDLLHHRAEGPAELVRRQAAAWDPILEWGRGALGLDLPVVTGVIAPARDASALIARALALDVFRLTALAHATALFGSAWLGFALLLGRIAAEEAFALSRIDEDFQAEQWGVDAEAADRASRLAEEAKAVGRFIALLD